MVLQWCRAHLSLPEPPLAASGVACSELPGVSSWTGVGPAFASWELRTLAAAGSALCCEGFSPVPSVQGSMVGAAPVWGAIWRSGEYGCTQSGTQQLGRMASAGMLKPAWSAGSGVVPVASGQASCQQLLCMLLKCAGPVSS